MVTIRLQTFPSMNNAHLLRLLSRTALVPLVTLAASLWLGMSATAGQEKLAAKMSETSTELVRTRDQLQATLDALGALVRQESGALKPAYDAYCAEVAKTQTSAKWTAESAATLKREGSRYFGDWEKELSGISNPSLQKKALSRMNRVRKNYDNVSKALEKASAKFEPFLSDLSDIQKVLANDLTAGGLKSLRRTVSSAEFNVAAVRAAFDTAAKELTKVSEALRPEAR